MTRVPVQRDKYFLRDLHQEIDLYDRKLAYLDKWVDFDSSADRKAAEDRLHAKRAPLEKAALALVASGIEYDEKDLPRSFQSMPHKRKSDGRHLFLIKKA